METTLHDGNIRKVADELHLVLEKLKEVEVLPHHFDYPLIDKFLDVADFSGEKTLSLKKF